MSALLYVHAHTHTHTHTWYNDGLLVFEWQRGRPSFVMLLYKWSQIPLNQEWSMYENSGRCISLVCRDVTSILHRFHRETSLIYCNDPRKKKWNEIIIMKKSRKVVKEKDQEKSLIICDVITLTFVPYIPQSVNIGKMYVFSCAFS